MKRANDGEIIVYPECHRNICCAKAIKSLEVLVLVDPNLALASFFFGLFGRRSLLSIVHFLLFLLCRSVKVTGENRREGGGGIRRGSWGSR